MEQKDIDYFNREKNNKNPIFFSRFPQIKYAGLKILDLGCGHGAISIDLAIMGAAEITGVDIDCDRIYYAKENLKTNYPQFQDKVKFKCCDLKEVNNDYFDIIISKASFEHIIELEVLLAEMRNKLKVGGKIVTGFGPLYNSPWGDHNRLRHKLPWTHVIFGSEHFIKKLNVAGKDNIKTIYDLGLNGYSLKKYKDCFYHTKDLKVVDFRTNVSHKFSMKLFNIFASIRFLKEYFTYNIYCVLERCK